MKEEKDFKIYYKEEEKKRIKNATSKNVNKNYLKRMKEREREIDSKKGI